MTEQSTSPAVVGSAYVLAVLGISAATLSRMIADGRVEPVGKISDAPNGAYIFDRAAIDALAPSAGVR